MTFPEIRKREGRISGLVALERVMPSRVRARVKKFLILFAPMIMLLLLIFENQQILSPNALYSSMFLVIAAWLVLFMLDTFYYSHYFEGAYYALPEWGIERYRQSVPFEVLEIVSLTHSSDFTAGLLASRAGQEMMKRMSITQRDVESFLNSGRTKVYADPINILDPINLISYSAAIYDADQDFAEFVSRWGMKREDFLETAAWVASIYERQKEMYRWWGRDSLGRIRGVGKGWSKSSTYLLEEFGHQVVPDDSEDLFKKEIDALEHALARAPGGNILFIADQHNKLETVVSGVAYRIHDGSILPQLQHKQLIELDIDLIERSSEAADKGFKNLFALTFNQAIVAGNIIMVINSLPALILAAKKRNIEILDIFEPYLASPSIDIIAFSAKNTYIDLIEPNPRLKNWFSMIFIDHDDQAIIVRALQHKTFETERITHLYFTHQSLVEIANFANQNLPADVIETRALELFNELVPKLIKRGRRQVNARDVQEILIK